MPEPITDDPDATTTTPSGKKVVLPPPRGQSSDMYNADPADAGDDSPHTTDFLKRFDPDATKGLTDQLSGIERQRGAAEQKQLGDLSGQMARDRAQMETAFHAEAQSANSIPPQWNADQERKERETGPIESFASIGSIFGLLASAFTKTPLTSALNASAAAMNSIHQHDEEGYKSAYEAWKENTALALKRFGMERDMFEDANKLISTDLEGWKIKQLAIAAQFDNKKAIAMLDAGMDDKIIEMQAAQVRAAEGVVKAQQEWADFDTKRNMVKALFRENDAALPPPPKISGATPQQQKEADQKYYKENPGALPQWKALYRGYATIKAQGASNTQESILNDARMEAAAQGKVLSAEEEAAIIVKSYRTGANAFGATSSLPEILQTWTDVRRGQPVTPEMRAIIQSAYLTKGAMAGPKIAQIGGALAEIKSRIDSGEKLDDATQEQILRDTVKQPPTGVSLDKEDADLIADQYLSGDRQAAAGFARSAQNMAMIRKSITDKAKKAGMSGPDIAMKIAEFHGIQAAESMVGRREATIEMFADETLRVIATAERASKDVPRGEFVPFNRALQAFERNSGDPKIVALGAALNAVINTYAKAINGGQQGTVSDKDHAREIVELAYSDKQMGSVFNIMKQELDAAKAAPGDVKRGLKDLAAGKKDTPPPNDPNVIRYDADGNKIQ